MQFYARYDAPVFKRACCSDVANAHFVSCVSVRTVPDFSVAANVGCTGCECSIAVSGRTAALSRTRRSPPPLAWFLPGPIRMRGGLAQHFASDWLLHRGIQAESTLRIALNKVIQ
jgi:hypothetical protein